MATRKQRKNKQNRTKGKRRVQKGGFFDNFFGFKQKDNSEPSVEQSNGSENKNEVPELQKQETMGGKRRNKGNNK